VCLLSPGGTRLALSFDAEKGAGSRKGCCNGGVCGGCCEKRSRLRAVDKASRTGRSCPAPVSPCCFIAHTGVLFSSCFRFDTIGLLLRKVRVFPGPTPSHHRQQRRSTNAKSAESVAKSHARRNPPFFRPIELRGCSVNAGPRLGRGGASRPTGAV